jgi:hypothetical protein
MRSTTIGNDNAKLVRYAVDPLRGVVVELVREWDHMDARTSKTSVDAMSGTGPVINPLASSLTYSGTWYRSKPTNAVESDMRGVVVTETLVPNTTASSTWTHAVNCGEIRTISLTEDLTQTGLDSLLQPYATASLGHYYMVDVSRQEDGRFTARITDRASQTHSQTAFTSRTSSDGIETTERKFNQDDSNGWASSGQGIVVSVDATKNEFCKYDKTQRSFTSTERTLAEHTAENAAGYAETRSKTYNDRTAPVSAPAGGTGVINTVRSEQAEDGTYTNDATSRTSKLLTASGSSNAAGYTEAVSTTHNALTVPAATGGTGIIQSVDANPNQDGTANIRIASRTSRELTSSGSASAEGYSEERSTTKSTTSVPTATSSLGVIGTVDSTPNDDGTHDARVSSRTSAEQEASAGESASGFTVSTTNLKNHRTEISAPTGKDVGIVYSLDSRKNDDGTWEIRASTRTAIELSAVSGDDATGFTESRTVTKSTTTIPSATGSTGVIATVTASPNDDGTSDVRESSRSSHPLEAPANEDAEAFTVSKSSTRNALSITSATASLGVIESVSAQANDDGTYDVSIQSRTSHPQEAAGEDEAEAYTVSTTNYKSQTAEVSAPGASTGIIGSVDNRKNDDGTFDARTTSRTSHEQTSYGNDDAEAFTNSTTHVKSTTTEASATASIGIIEQADNRKNDDGTLDTTLVSKTSHEQTAYGNTIAAGYTVASTNVKSTTTPLSASSPYTQGVIETADNRKNDDGTYDGTISSKTSQSRTADTTYGSLLHDTSRTVISSATAAPTGSASSTGVVTSVSISNNDDGTIDGVVESTSAKSFTSPAYISERTPKRIDSSTLFSGLTAPLDSDLSTSTYGSLSARIAEDLTYSGVLTSSTYILDGGAWDSDVALTASVTAWVLRDHYGVTQKRAVVSSRTAKQFDSWKDCFEYITGCETLGYEAKMPLAIGSGAYVGIVETVTGYGAWADI